MNGLQAISSLNAINPVNKSNNLDSSSSLQNLGAELKINKEIDQAADLKISPKIKNRIEEGFNSSSNRNLQGSISLLQVADGAMSYIQDITQKIRMLCIAASSAGISDEEKQNLQDQIDNLEYEISRCVSNAKFDNYNLIDGDLVCDFTIQTAPETAETLSINIKDMSVSGQGYPKSFIKIGHDSNIGKSLEYIDQASNYISSARDEISTVKNKIESVPKHILSTKIWSLRTDKSVEDAENASNNTEIHIKNNYTKNGYINTSYPNTNLTNINISSANSETIY